jgi:hypothetical protein
MYSRLFLAFLFAIPALAGCERSPGERLALKHAEQQSQINSENFERANQLREEAEEDKAGEADKQDKQDKQDGE